MPGCYVTTQVRRASLACLASNVYLSSLGFSLGKSLCWFITQLLSSGVVGEWLVPGFLTGKTPGFSRRDWLRLVYVFSLVFPLH